MSDTTDLNEQMPVAPDADGGDQLVDDGGFATLLIQETTEPEAARTGFDGLERHGNQGHQAPSETLHSPRWL